MLQLPRNIRMARRLASYCALMLTSAVRLKTTACRPI
jgi:hypothetical protein